MNNEKTNSPFPVTRQDLANLKNTAIDAACDVSSTAAAHAQKAQGQLKDLVSHARTESVEELDQVKNRFADVGVNIRNYVTSRPLASLGTALAVGFLIGVTRRRSSRVGV